MTEREKELKEVIVSAMETFIKEHGELDRSELMGVYSWLARILFTIQTPYNDIDEQCKEIAAFCEFLNGVARKSIT